MSSDTGPEVVQIHVRLRAIHDSKMACHDRLAALAFEEASLYARLNEIERPTMTAPKARHCRQCGNKTLDRFGDAPQCAKHVANGDTAIRSILEDFING